MSTVTFMLLTNQTRHAPDATNDVIRPGRITVTTVSLLKMNMSCAPSEIDSWVYLISRKLKVSTGTDQELIEIYVNEFGQPLMRSKECQNSKGVLDI